MNAQALSEWVKAESEKFEDGSGEGGQKALGKQIGVKQPTVSSWANMKVQSLKAEQLVSISSYRGETLDQTARWLGLRPSSAPCVSETPGSYRISDRFRMPTKSELHDPSLNIAESIDLMKQLSDLQAELVVALRHKIESQGIPTNEEFPISPTICCVKKLLVEQLGGWRGIMKQAIDFAKRSTSDYKGDADRWIELFEGRGDPDDDDLLCIIVTLTLLFSGNDFMKEELSKCHQYRLMESCLPQKNRAENPAISRT